MNCRHRLQYVINALYDLRELRTVCRSSDITPLSWPFQRLNLITWPFQRLHLHYLSVPATAHKSLPGRYGFYCLKGFRYGKVGHSVKNTGCQTPAKQQIKATTKLKRTFAHLSKYPRSTEVAFVQERRLHCITAAHYLLQCSQVPSLACIACNIRCIVTKIVPDLLVIVFPACIVDGVILVLSGIITC